MVLASLGNLSSNFNSLMILSPKKIEAKELTQNKIIT